MELTGIPTTRTTADIRPVPQALDIEKSVLSVMSSDPATYIGRSITMGVSEDYFYLPAHRLLWNLFRDRYNSNQSVELMVVRQVLNDRKQLEAVGGDVGLADIYGFTYTSAFFDEHLEILKNKYVLRSIIEVSGRSTTRAYEDQEEVAGLLDSVEADIFNIRERIGKGNEQSLVSYINEASNNFEELIYRMRKGLGTIQGISSGFEKLDEKSNGLKAGDMFVVAARPSMGKTSFLLNIIEHIAVAQKKPTLLFSCEMPAVQIVERLLFSNSGLSRSQIVRKGNLSKLEMDHFKKAVKELKAAPLVIDDTPAISITELRAKARRVMRDHGSLSAIGVDYLQLMRSHTKQAQNSREREIAEISSGLKALAKELKVPVIVLAQLNRGPESRTGASRGKPMMSDLRESGAIEQDADMIGLLYRSAYYADDEEERVRQAGRANLVLAKNRNGATGDVPLHFEAELMRFSTRERDENDEED